MKKVFCDTQTFLSMGDSDTVDLSHVLILILSGPSQSGLSI